MLPYYEKIRLQKKQEITENILASWGVDGPDAMKNKHPQPIYVRINISC